MIGFRKMPLLSDVARKRKIDFFLPRIVEGDRVLEIGCGDGWFGRALAERCCVSYTGIDLAAPADIVGDVREWESLGMTAESFDVIAAFEVVEHVDCFAAMHALLRKDGLLMLTSPHPGMDWFCRLLESAGLTQQRTSPHNCLVDFHRIPLFEPVRIKRVGLAAQWGVFKKT